MSDLVVLGFDGTGAADEVLTKLRSLKKENLIDLEDACVVVRDGAGAVQIKQAVHLVSLGAASGASTGMLIGALAGLLVLNPLAGMAVGGLAGAGLAAAAERHVELIRGLVSGDARAAVEEAKRLMGLLYRHAEAVASR